MVVLKLYSASMKTIPAHWKPTMPNLQQLSLSDRSVKEPSEFSWNNSTLNLFHGLRRITPTLISLFCTPLSIERNLYPRAVSLDYNNIEDLSSHIFRGFLHLLFIFFIRHGLKAVGPSCFRNLEGLEVLALSNAKLASLPETLRGFRIDLKENGDYMFIPGNVVGHMNYKANRFCRLEKISG